MPEGHDTRNYPPVPPAPDLSAVFKEIRDTRVEITKDVGALRTSLGTTREEAATMRQRIDDHEQNHITQPCDGMKKWDRRIWAVVFAALACVAKAIWDVFRGP